MSKLLQFTVCILFFGGLETSGKAAYTSLYVFGDGACTTTNSPGGLFYYGHRYCNGRVWVEVLAQRQGLVHDPNKNLSFFGHYSPNLVANVSNFVAPTDVNSALFVVWVNNADFVYNIVQYAPYTTNNLATWTNAINQSLNNHLTAIQTLYAKGVRTLIMPNAVDLTKVPYFVGLSSPNKSFIRQRIVDFNIAFAAKLNRARASFTNLAIYCPDMFTLLDNLVAQPANFGLINALLNGLSVDALDDPLLLDKSLNGPGANYLFWDYMHPTARCQALAADLAHQLISPVQINQIASLNGSNRLGLANVPIGRNGFVETSTNLVHWTLGQSINCTNATQTIFVPAAEVPRFYRVCFPFAWSWP